MPYFLLEIGTEEIPDWMIEPALEDLRARYQAAFGQFEGSAIIVTATPRRLILLAKNILEKAPDVETVAPGPYVSAGVKAAEGFARKQGVGLEQLKKAADAKGERYVFAQLTKGRLAIEALAEKLPEVIAGIHFPKSMYWTGKNGVRFIRPIRWIVALLDEQIVRFEVAGVQSGNLTRGHRVLGARGPLTARIPTYLDVLRENGVIVHAEERRKRIEDGLGPGVQRDDELLKTLVYLTEFPTPIRGSFDASYLELPKEILSTVMRHHQRYFSVLKEDGSLAPEFVAVTNTDGDPDGLIRQGNERVLRARFNDARFFWKVDQQKTLADRVPDLAKITFQAQLGSYLDKSKRVRAFASMLAPQLHADVESAMRAAKLCKCDLTTDMVKEFPELQGVVGGLYARAQGEGETVAMAIYDHYQPVGMEQPIPATLEGQVVSIADKIDTLVECFKIGLIPTGSKDPFALRRAAQGIVKILFEARLPVVLAELAQNDFQLAEFLRERIQTYLREVKNFEYDEVNAVMAPPITTLPDLADRAEAVREVRASDNFEPIAASFKRIKNILRQTEFSSRTVDARLLQNGPERELYEAAEAVSERIRAGGGYKERLEEIASLRPQIDLFFDKILVNDPNEAIRKNRLALLHSLLEEFSTIADFSEIVTRGQAA
ncbi:MAG TPA: glycine--tRNA ligase subunit beta [Bryobacteraceae bacterium]|jgi:glycyl-tRNA synthetase beta chain|nr:glycine--tRNA ligase subunit beta [Bryobacteraceae bacterium]